jgi:hypothetical protein
MFFHNFLDPAPKGSEGVGEKLGNPAARSLKDTNAVTFRRSMAGDQ